jgi:hypothetical protein
MRGTDRRSRPAGRWRNVANSSSASPISVVASRSRASKCAPTSVRETLRVVRWNSGNPTCASSARTAWLTAPGVAKLFGARVRGRQVFRKDRHQQWLIHQSR